jgi:hypothetical protein
MTMLTETEIGTGLREREVNFAQLTVDRRERNRTGRSPAVRKERFERRVLITKEARALQADPQHKKKLAAAEAAIVAAQKEYAAANEPFLRLEKAKAGMHNAEAARNGVEGTHRAALLALQRQADGLEDFLWSDVVAELQIALDEAFRSRGANAEHAQKILKAALQTASELPYRFVGSFAKWDAILARLKRLAQSRGTEMLADEKWDALDFFEPVETDCAGR